MPTYRESNPPGGAHRARRMAESFGVDAQRYDRARPATPTPW